MDFQDSHDRQYMTPNSGDADFPGLKADSREN
jgi:hypothetical protein